jgi:putative ABC transport system permease protein
MTVLPFAWRSLVRQPARSALGILGVAAVGALLFDMLLLSQGLIVSMRDILDRTGYDVRVTTTTDLPRAAPRLDGAAGAVSSIEALPGVRTAIAIRFADATLERAGRETLAATFQGVTGRSAPWTILRGAEPSADGIVVNELVAQKLGLEPGSELLVRPACGREAQALPPVPLRVSGIARFPFELTAEHNIGARLGTLDEACGRAEPDQADMVLIASTGDAEATARAVRTALPGLETATNEQMLGRIQQGGFTYFRQISSVLTTVTVAFALLLITVLLTVSVNQRLGEIAAVRALGFSRRRVVADVLCESALIVGIGGAISLPTGLLLAQWLDRILKAIPTIPADLHFFVFEPSALVIHVSLLTATAFLAALYPMRIVSRLPIAATLRSEVTS